MSNTRKTTPAPKRKSLVEIIAQGEEQNRRTKSAVDRYVDDVRRQDERKRNGNWMTGLDGYDNPLAGLGESSTLFSAGTFQPTRMTQNLPALTNAYRGSWLARKIIDMPAEDMTMKWYRFSTTLPQEDLQKLKELEATHSVKQELTNAIQWARLYGGCMVLMVVKELFNDDLSQPLDTGTAAGDAAVFVRGKL